MKKNKGYKYVVWAVAAVIYVVVFFHRVALGAVKDEVLVQIGVAGTVYEGSLFALLTSMYMYAYMFMQIPTGILADTLGPRKTISLGSLLASIGTVGFVVARSMYTASFWRLLIGVGVAVVFVCTLKIIEIWFPKEEFTVMSGVTSFVGNMGAILAMTPLVYLSGKIGWQNALLLIGGISFVFAFISWLVIRDKKKEVQGNQPKIKMHDVCKQLRRIFGDGRLYPVMIAFGLTFGGTIALTGTWGIEMVQELYDVSKNTAANAMGLVTLGVAIGSILIGKIAKKLKSQRKPMLIFSILHLVFWGLLLIRGMNTLGLQFVFFGLGLTGTSFIVSWDYAKSKYEGQYSGTVMSVVNFFGFLGGAIVPQVIGIMYDLLGSYGPVQKWYIILVGLAINALISVLLFASVKDVKNRL